MVAKEIMEHESTRGVIHERGKKVFMDSFLTRRAKALRNQTKEIRLAMQRRAIETPVVADRDRIRNAQRRKDAAMDHELFGTLTAESANRPRAFAPEHAITKAAAAKRPGQQPQRSGGKKREEGEEESVVGAGASDNDKVTPAAGQQEDALSALAPPPPPPPPPPCRRGAVAALTLEQVRGKRKGAAVRAREEAAEYERKRKEGRERKKKKKKKAAGEKRKRVVEEEEQEQEQDEGEAPIRASMRKLRGMAHGLKKRRM